MLVAFLISRSSDMAEQIQENETGKQAVDERPKIDPVTGGVIGSGILYNGPLLSLMGFACSTLLAVAAYYVMLFLLLSGLGANNSAFLVGIAASSAGMAVFTLIGYSIIMVALAVASYRNLKKAKEPSSGVAALFTFSFVSALVIWLGFGGVLSALVAYFIMAKNQWV